MASERYGRAFEAIIVGALRKSGSRILKQGEVRWNEPIPGQSVMPDVWISSSNGIARVIFLVTHSGAPSASEKKFWRNVGELAEAKLLLSPPPTIISVLFDNAIKKSLGELELRLFDAYVDIPGLDAVHAKVFSVTAEKLANGKAQPQDFPDLISEMEREDSQLHRAIGWLRGVLSGLIERPELPSQAQLWESIGKRHLIRPTGRVPKARSTSIRRGIAKLLITESPGRFLDSTHLPTGSPSYLVTLGLVKKTINGLQIADPEIKNALKIISHENLTEMFSLYSCNAGLQTVIRPLRHFASSAPSMQDYIFKNWTEIIDKKGFGLFKHLQLTHKGGPELLSLNKGVYVRPGWLFLLLVALLKAHHKRRQSFGYAKLIKKLEGLDPEQLTFLVAGAKKLKLPGPLSLRSPRTIEYGLRDWFYGSDRTNFTLNPFELLACASIIACELSVIQVHDVATLVVEASRIEVSDQVENILVTYNGFQPLKEMILIATKKAGLTPNIIQYFPNPLREQAVASGLRLNIRAGATEVIKVGKTIIRWISVTNEGKDHKRKEFAGRGALLNMTWDNLKNRYVAREDVVQLILVIDGTFLDSDIDVLHRLGWDHIFYPDEMDALVEAIV